MPEKYKNIKVGKNQIFWDGEVWNVEVFEFMDGKTPMYSLANVYKKKETAMKVAKIVDRNNVSRIVGRYPE